MYRNILVGFDGSPGAMAALTQAARLAAQGGGSVTALWIHSSLPHLSGTAGEMRAEREAADAFFEKLRARLRQFEKTSGVPVPLERQTGNPSQALVRFAEKRRCDLIVMGHSGHSRLWGRLLGHTTDRVSENAHCDVLIVRARPGGRRASKAAAPEAESP